MRQRIAIALLVVAALTVLVATGCANDALQKATATTTATLTLAPDADARVEQGSTTSTTNYGSSTGLGADLSPDELTYIRFTVATTDPVTSAKLRLNVTNASVDGPGVRTAANEWSESTITYANRPAVGGTMVADKANLPTGWTEFDVSSIVQEAGTYTLVLVGTSSDGADFASRESGTAPELVITTHPPTEGTTLPAEPTPDPTTPPDTPGSAVFVGAGDIATSSSSNADEATARLLDGVVAQYPDATVYTLGDNAYPDGTASNFTNYYEPTWGRHKARTKPTPGNHDYYTSEASGYFGYFGVAAGEVGKGYYAYDIGSWRAYALNSNIDVTASSAQVAWLKKDLAANPRKCAVAYFHHPLFSSGYHGNQTKMRPVWDALHASGADLVLSGHDHSYERFAPQNPDGTANAAGGIREFVVGTGGVRLRSMVGVKPNSEFRNDTEWGVLKLTLKDGAYDFAWLTTDGATSDSGTGTCHQ